MFDIQENLKLLPEKPGVYIHKDALGQIIYVGKAVSLRRRVRQYFQSKKNMPEKVKSMVEHIEEFEYIITDSEMEALILECNLIKKYKPKYNILLRDDKTYPYIKVTMRDRFPRVLKTRRVTDDGSRYFGPYSDAGAVNEIIDLLDSVYMLKRCSASSFSDDFRPCLNYHIEQCRGICNGKVTQEEYATVIEKVLDFLKGHNKPVIEMLEQKMQEAAAKLDFEKAAEYRDRITDVKTIGEKQKVVLSSAGDMDLLLTANRSSGAYVILFYVRGGKLSGRDSFHMDVEGEDERGQMISSFIKQYYTKELLIPKELAVEYEPEDIDVLKEWLTAMKGSKVNVYKPQKGDKHALMEMASRDVIEMMKGLDEKAEIRRERVNAVGAELNRIFGEKWMELSGENHSSCSWRIEAYDISNTSGVDSVGGMVVFENGKPQRRDYRKFKIKTIDGPDDYASMREVIYRRFRRAQKGDPGFAKRPDILFVDGGQGHISAVTEVLDAMGENIIVAGMVKDDRHRTRGLIFDGNELELKEFPVLFRYVTGIQDEVHRFAIDYHHSIRNKSMSKSVLDDAPGIGARRKESLLKHFGSIEKIKEADMDSLSSVDGMTKKSAQQLKDYFKELDSKGENDGLG